MEIVRPLVRFLPVLAWVLAGAALAAGPDQPSVEERLLKLEQQQAAAAQPVPPASILPANLQVSGLVEVEGTVGESYDGRSYSDLTVATVELDVDAQVNERVTAHLVFLYEQDETDFGVDEATLTISQLIAPLDFTVGKMYVPFGALQTALVNDTLVLELAEINKTAALFGLDQAGVQAMVYVFDGDQDREKHVENYGLAVGFVQDSFTVGLDYLSSLTESDGFEDALDAYSEFWGAIPPFDGWEESAPAYSAHGRLVLGSVTLIAEYLDTVEPLQPAGTAIEIEPSALQCEANLTAVLADHEYVFAIAYQKTDDAVALELPEERVSVGISSEIYRHVRLSTEFWHDTDYSVADGGSDEQSDNIVLQLAAFF